jgi:uncharacterized membrane protein
MSKQNKKQEIKKKKGKPRLFTSEYQPSREAKSKGQQKRNMMKRMMQALLDAKPVIKEIEEFKKLNPNFDGKIDNKVVAFAKCLSKMKETGSARALKELLILAGLHIEKFSFGDLDDEEQIEKIEYL